MNLPYFHLTLLLITFPFNSFAQKETNIWYFGNKAGLDFNYNPPKILHDGALKSHEGSSVISDKNGNLLFYTNGETVWNRHHEIMDNGSDLGGDQSSRQAAVIVPKPNEEGLYYIFTVDAKENNHIKGLRYSIVNINANNELGKVTEKGEILHAPGTEGLSVVGNCIEDAKREYWVLTAKEDNKGKVFAYKIDKNGIDEKPVISSISTEGNINYIKFDPAGNKVAMLEVRKDAGEDNYVFIGDFDFGSGLINNLIRIKVEVTGYFNQVEFSPNGKLLYISSGNSINQIDLNTPNYQIISSVETNMYIMGDFQIAPDGNIYIASFTTNFLSLIKNPNEKGLSGRYFEHYIDLGKESLLSLPNFVRNFLYNNFTTYAGKDSLICSNEPLQLGIKPETGLRYQWYPSLFLNKDNIANPIFTFTNSSNEIQEFEYVLTASDEFCSRTDTVKIEVYPAPPEKITGSKSVCPGVTGVEYSVPSNNYFSWHWEVGGGTIAEGQGTAQITIDWGPSNPDAYVKLIANSLFGCGNKILELPVRINVELDTETPWGPHEICFNQRQGITYSTTKTNGSVYTWEITGGIIKSGQGGHQVLVDWEGIGNHKIWVHEKSVTIDTICYGISEIFEVKVFKDTHEIIIDYVSISIDDEKLGIIQVNEAAILKTKGDYALYRKEWGAGDWNLVAEVSKDQTLFIDGILSSDELSYEYKISSLNPCEEEIESLSHRTIHLYADVPNENDQIFLKWNPYEGWPQKVEKYEIWHKVDLDEEYKLIGVTEPQVLNYIADNGKEGFTHYFRIKAIGNVNGYESWSNEASLNFNHNIIIPNVFTPNGDGFNETFTIVKLEMYPANELTIFNRWGKTIFNKIGYQNEWSGEEVSSGVYYYSLKIDSLKRNYKGWVHVLK